jgi:hypothetical protein
MRQAIEDGADWLEIDVQESADGEVIVIHDSDFMKLAGVDLKVWDGPLDQIREIDVGSWFDPRFSAERVPTLAEVLELARGKARVIGFAHGTELRLETSGLRGGKTERGFQLRSVQPQQATCCGGGPEGTRRCRLVKAGLIVTAPKPEANPNRNLGPKQRSPQHVFARFPAGKRGGKHGNRRMTDMSEMRIVIVKRVAGRAVDHCGGRGALDA